MFGSTILSRVYETKLFIRNFSALEPIVTVTPLVRRKPWCVTPLQCAWGVQCRVCMASFGGKGPSVVVPVGCVAKQKKRGQVWITRGFTLTFLRRERVPSV